MAELTTRFATPDDADAITELWVQSWLDTYIAPEHGVTADYVAGLMTRRSSAQGREALRSAIARGHDSRQAFFVAEADGRIVGIAGPRVTDEGVQRVGALYAERAWHGRGVGAALMIRVLAWRDPSLPLFLEVAPYNGRARAFYRKWGFVDVPGSESHNGQIPTIMMVLEPGQRPLPPLRARRKARRRRFRLGLAPRSRHGRDPAG